MGTKLMSLGTQKMSLMYLIFKQKGTFIMSQGTKYGDIGTLGHKLKKEEKMSQCPYGTLEHKNVPLASLVRNILWGPQFLMWGMVGKLGVYFCRGLENLEKE